MLTDEPTSKHQNQRDHERVVATNQLCMREFVSWKDLKPSVFEDGPGFANWRDAVQEFCDSLNDGWKDGSSEEGEDRGLALSDKRSLGYPWNAESHHADAMSSSELHGACLGGLAPSESE